MEGAKREKALNAARRKILFERNTRISCHEIKVMKRSLLIFSYKED